MWDELFDFDGRRREGGQQPRRTGIRGFFDRLFGAGDDGDDDDRRYGGRHRDGERHRSRRDREDRFDFD